VGISRFFILFTTRVSSIGSTGLAARLLLLLVVLVVVLLVILVLVVVPRPILVPIAPILLRPPPERGVGVDTVSILMVLPVRILVGHPAGPYAVDLVVLICERLGRALGVPDIGVLLLSPHRALRLHVVHRWRGVEVKRVVDLVVVMGVAIVQGVWLIPVEGRAAVLQSLWMLRQLVLGLSVQALLGRRSRRRDALARGWAGMRSLARKEFSGRRAQRGGNWAVRHFCEKGRCKETVWVGAG